MARTIELRQLRYFLALAEELHFGRAAQHLGISQPPVSRQIKDLEASLGLPLFQRHKHVVRLTPAGQVFLHETRRTLEQLYRSVELAQRAHRGELGHLELGMAPSLEFSVYRTLEREMKKALPHVETKCHVLFSHEQVPLIRTGALDAGFVRLPLEEHNSLALDFLFREGLVAAIVDGNPLATRKALRISDLAGQKLIVLRKNLNTALYAYLEGLCHRGGYHMGRVKPVDSVADLLNALLKGDGVAILPASFKRQLTKGIHRSRILDKNADVQVALMYRRDNPPNIVHLLRRIAHEIRWPNLI